VRHNGEEVQIEADGGGSIEAFVNAMQTHFEIDCRVLDYHEHSIGSGTDAQAVTYAELELEKRTIWGVGIHTDVTSSSLQAIVSGINRAL
jgi:2-isopropylmalate synthase